MPSTEAGQAYRRSLHGGGLRVLMQPVVDLRSGDIHLFESLARLELADGITATPDDFLPHLSAADVSALFRMCLDAVLLQVAEWDRNGLHLDVSVNVAPTTLREPICPRWVSNSLSGHGIEPYRLGLELLEQDIMDDETQFEVFGQLRALGVKLTMDDLGSGHSSLELLAAAPFDAFKIDRALVAQMRDTPVAALTTLAALIRLAADRGQNLVIEGLEDAALAEAAAVLGTPYGQGYFLARPMPLDSVPEWSRRPRTGAYTGTVRTALGALAYQWRCDHGSAAHPGPVQDCPMTSFLASPDLQGTPARGWHNEQHGPVFEGRSSAGLLAWLEDLSRTASAI